MSATNSMKMATECGEASTSPISEKVQKEHKRTYQACTECRRRKVKCDLGSTDHPEPPCARCIRESIECLFTELRRKTKNGGEDDEPVYEIKAGRKRLRAASSLDREDIDDESEDSDVPVTPGGSKVTKKPNRRSSAKRKKFDEEELKRSEIGVALLQMGEGYGGYFSLSVSSALHGLSNDMTSLEGPSSGEIDEEAIMNGQGASSTRTVRVTRNKAVINVDDPDTRAALYAWSRCVVVREDTLTAQQAIEYIDYFHSNLAPLTAVDVSHFRPHSSHNKLLTEEPMLAITMLMVTSRHMDFGSNGVRTRQVAIYQKLWEHVKIMLDKLTMGLEHVSSGFRAIQRVAASDVNPLTRIGLRTLGAVQALILLTEWQPRTLQFECRGEFMLPEPSVDSSPLTNNAALPQGIGGRRMEAWLEPYWRSDRVSWMLLGVAQSLAAEIGVFDNSGLQQFAGLPNGQTAPAVDLETYVTRRDHVRELIVIHVVQTSGRFGLTAMNPHEFVLPRDSQLLTIGITPQSSVEDTVLHFWLRIAQLMQEGNTNMYANTEVTRELVRSGNYKTEIDALQPALQTLLHDLNTCVTIPKHIRSILEIEFEYCRIYTNGLALQAVVERCASHLPLRVPNPSAETSHPPIATNGIRTDVVIDPATLAKCLGGDRVYIDQVSAAARHLLAVVIADLAPDGYLAHVPARTYFRIANSAIMLGKSFVLGAHEKYMTESLALMQRAAKALRESVVDDVHLARRFAALLQMLFNTLYPQLKRFSNERRGRRGTGSKKATSSKAPVKANPEMEPEAESHTTTGAASTSHQSAFNNQIMTTAVPSGNGNNNYTGQVATPSSSSSPNFDFSMMPPPSPNNFMSGGLPAMGMNAPAGAYPPSAFVNNQDWYSLPLDPLFNLPVDVEQMTYGLPADNVDILDYYSYNANGARVANQMLNPSNMLNFNHGFDGTNTYPGNGNQQ